MYPDEAKRPGSATAFIALHDRLLHRDLFALCSFVRSRDAEPRLVAMVPQAEEVDPSGYQVPFAPVNPKCYSLNPIGQCNHASEASHARVPQAEEVDPSGYQVPFLPRKR